MKKIFSLLLIGLLSITLIGCEDKEEKDIGKDNDKVVEKEELTLVFSKTYKWESNGEGATIIFNENGTVESSAWAKDAGNTKYKGTYVVDGVKVIVTDTEYYDITEWSRLPKEQAFEYTIVNEDTIKREYNGKELTYNIS